MDTLQNLQDIPALPRNEQGPLFAEPWQLTAFGIVLSLHQNGAFEWREWVNYLSTEITSGKDYGVSDHNSIYYHQWLAALEKLVTDKNLSTFEEMMVRKEQWRHADEHRGFGEPLSLHGHDHDDDHHHHHHQHGDHHHHHAHDHRLEPICRSPAQRVGAA